MRREGNIPVWEPQRSQIIPHHLLKINTHGYDSRITSKKTVILATQSMRWVCGEMMKWESGQSSPAHEKVGLRPLITILKAAIRKSDSRTISGRIPANKWSDAMQLNDHVWRKAYKGVGTLDRILNRMSCDWCTILTCVFMLERRRCSKSFLVRDLNPKAPTTLNRILRPDPRLWNRGGFYRNDNARSLQKLSDGFPWPSACSVFSPDLEQSSARSRRALILAWPWTVLSTRSLQGCVCCLCKVSRWAFVAYHIKLVS